MTETGLALFDTPVGPCGIAWRGSALVGLQLPERDSAATQSRLQRRFPRLQATPPPPWVRNVIQRINRLLAGEVEDLIDVPLDLASVGTFDGAVYLATRAVGPGRTVSYGEIARRVGDARQARAVGQALGRNPWPIVVPCHRITASGGRTGGFSAAGGRAAKLRLLELEGALDPATLPLFASART